MDQSYAISVILLSGCGLITSYCLSIFVAVFQFGYLNLGAQHRKATLGTFVIGFFAQISIVYSHIYRNDTSYCIFGICVYSFTMTMVLTELYFCEILISISPLLTKRRISWVRWVVWIIFLMMMASFLVRFVGLGIDRTQTSQMYLMMKNFNDSMVRAFQLSNFISGPPLKLYCILRLGEYAREKSTNGKIGGKIAILTKLSLMNFSLDVASYLFALSTYWLPGEWQQVAPLGAGLLLLHCVVYCYIFKYVVQVTFPGQYNAKMRKANQEPKEAPAPMLTLQSVQTKESNMDTMPVSTVQIY